MSDEVKIDNMPVFVIKAKDRLAIDAIIDYRGLCTAHGLDEQAGQVQLAIDEIAVWQDSNRHLVQLPDHQHVPVSAPSEPVRPEPRVLGYTVLKEYPDGRWVDYGVEVRDTEEAARADADTIRAEWSPTAVIVVAALTEVVEPAEKPKCGPDPKIRDTYGEFALEVFDLEPGNDDCFVVLLRNDEEVKHFTYPAYKIWTLLAHWKEYDEVNPAAEVVEP